MHSKTHDADHYEIGSDRDEIGGPSMSEDAFPQGVSLGWEGRPEIGMDIYDMMGAAEQTNYGNDLMVPQFAEEEGMVGVAEQQAAVKQVIKTARDLRQPPPKMVAVPAYAPVEDDYVSEWFADIAVDTGVLIGVGDPLPIMTKLLTRFGAGQEKPWFVRVDTEETYPAFIASNSPDMAELKGKVEALHAVVHEHMSDPDAHAELLDAIDEVESLGAEVSATEKAKEIELWLPKWAEGKIHAWKEGDFICASIFLPGCDGELRICTSITPVVRAVEEMEHYASVAKVNAAAVIGVLPAMGCVLGAGTLVKEMSSAAPSILNQPAAASKKPFLCRIEPLSNPAICSFVALLQMCKDGSKQACGEWDAMVSAADKGGATYVVKAMNEAKNLFLQACKA